jgi:hypothetical protein
MKTMRRWGGDARRRDEKNDGVNSGRLGFHWSLNIAIAVSPLLMVTLRDFVAPLAGLQLTE